MVLFSGLQKQIYTGVVLVFSPVDLYPKDIQTIISTPCLKQQHNHSSVVQTLLIATGQVGTFVIWTSCPSSHSVVVEYPRVQISEGHFHSPITALSPPAAAAKVPYLSFSLTLCGTRLTSGVGRLGLSVNG